MFLRDFFDLLRSHCYDVYMKSLHIIVIGFAFMCAPFYVCASGVVINEIAWMGSAPKNGEDSSSASSNEWIELKNIGSGSVDLQGWSLAAQDGTPNIVLTGVILAGGFFLLERTNDNTVPGITADVIYTGALSNSGEKLILKDGQGSIIDTVDATSGWPAGLVDTKETMQKASGWITAPPTPRGENAGSGSVSATPTPSTAPSISSSPMPHTELSAGSASAISLASPVKTIKVYGGEDVSSMVGAMINFLGRAKGLNDESIDSSARFVWNFGDGETQEGRSVMHTYRMPGTYMLGLYVSSGEYTASDYMRVQIGSNLVSVSGVVRGIDGYMRFANSSDIEADIGGWSIHDAAGHQFFIPSHTMMARRGDIAISNSVSGLLQEVASMPLSVFYPNGVLAFTYGGTTSVATVMEKKAPEEVVKLAQEIQKIVSSGGNETPIHSPDPVSVSPFINPAPVSDTKEYATVSRAPFVSIPFVIAIGISILGAGGFLISKKFFS